MSRTLPDFNLIAKSYRWLEFFTLGKTLENCRNHYLPQLLGCKRALVLGDGDGRFLAQLLKHNSDLHADAVDSSTTMLQLLRQRCETAIPDANTRLHTHYADALTFPLDDSESSYDLIVTHFFLDCFNQADLNALITRIAPTLAPNALWLISDFRTPSGPMHFPAKLIIRSLYLAFRVLTGLRTTHLPDHSAPLTNAGLTRISHRHRLAGLLTTELWQA
ncbi:MAG TPA: class I SAM-dependent methyltransferase [Edaphobacter sp.]|jgi:SAM-dependent methyltransferase|nr:class I SAM-dependent methyltransferase [Edaphobacter sp.]